MDITLQDSTFRELRDFVYEKSGIFISDSKKYFLENRFGRRLRETSSKSFEEYLSYLRKNGNGELKSVFDALTTNETYFFREPQQFDILIDSVLPRILEGRSKKEVSIWSAACSTGEEPYNISMLFMERAPGVRVDITGSDISSAALQSAQKAVYNSYSVRNVPEPYLRKYFRKNEQKAFELEASVKRPVCFSHINLINEKETRSIRQADIIFCRNVLIYFDEKAKERAVSHLYDRIKPGGFLFVGMSESLHNVTRAFRPIIMNRVVVYQRG